MVASDSARESAGQIGWLTLAMTALFALLAFRIIALYFNGTNLFFDEAQYWSWSLEPDFGYYSKPPLIAWVIHLATGVCGSSEFCVRLPSPILHFMTAAVVFALGRRLYNARCGFWSAVVYATLPGITASAGIISTDVPLLFFWALALYAAVQLIDSDKWWPALLLGVALGGGLNAKYAMAYFVPCLAVFIGLSRDQRRLATEPRLYVALLIGVALIVPNLLWNANNAFATFSHTADNANWTGSLVHPDRMAEFLASQFGVFGPILFGALVMIVFRAIRRGADGPELFLLCFTVPILVAAIVQAFLSRAHANWAAPSYVAAAVLVTASFLRVTGGRRWLNASLLLHGVILVAFAFGTAFAGRFAISGVDPFGRMLGWREVAQATLAVIADERRAGRPVGAVLTDDRQMTAELLYYMRAESTPVLAWREGPRPHDHYELIRPYVKGSPEPALLVTLRSKTPSKAIEQFTNLERLPDREVPAGASPARRVMYYRLWNYRGT
jgi:4-amino-4-deoxy-L-arabinose transferase-like glycosyltransferase